MHQIDVLLDDLTPSAGQVWPLADGLHVGPARHLPCGLICSGGTMTEGSAEGPADTSAAGSGSRLDTVTLAGALGWGGSGGGR